MSNPRQRAHRILRQLPLYSASEPSITSAPEDIRSLGGIVGVYNLQSADPADCVWIAEKGIWIHESGWEFIPYALVQRVVYPPAKGELETDLQLVMLDETRKRVRIVGGSGRVRDVYSFGHFLDRSIADVKAANRTGASPPPASFSAQ